MIAIFLPAFLVTSSLAHAVLGPALVFDADSGEVLIEERAQELWYPASLTKLMTAYLVFEAIEAGKLRLDQLIPVSEAAAKLPPSKIGIPAGLNIKLELALQSLLIHSANDMAVVLAEAVSGSAATFVQKMNATARRLEMRATRFANPHGLPDPRQVTTARDMGLLAGVILARFPQSRAYFAAPDFEIGEVTLRNRNGLLRQMPGADGMKTGFICASGFNLVASATFDDRRLIAVVLGAKSAPSRNVLTQVLLESAEILSRTPSERPTLLDMRDPPAAAGEPRSLHPMMCQGAGKVRLKSPDASMNWGVSFGRYPAPLTAEAIMTGRLLAAGSGAAAGRPRGIVHDSVTEEYLGLVWNMSMRDSISLCADVARHGAPCEVLSPRSFESIATDALAGGPAAPAAQQSEGSQ